MRTSTRSTRARRNNKRSAAAAPVAPAVEENPANLYVFSDFPSVGRELALYPVRARRDIVVTPTSIEVTNMYRIDEETGDVSYFDAYRVLGATDRGEAVVLRAETVPGLDELRLTAKPEFHKADVRDLTLALI